jgi:hypothetical protein
MVGPHKFVSQFTCSPVRRPLILFLTLWRIAFTALTGRLAHKARIFLALEGQIARFNSPGASEPVKHWMEKAVPTGLRPPTSKETKPVARTSSWKQAADVCSMVKLSANTTCCFLCRRKFKRGCRNVNLLSHAGDGAAESWRPRKIANAFELILQSPWYESSVASYSAMRRLCAILGNAKGHIQGRVLPAKVSDFGLYGLKMKLL